MLYVPEGHGPEQFEDIKPVELPGKPTGQGIAAAASPMQ
jgi:hypothetical protein